MGLFDTIRCEFPLPDPRLQNVEFQTKDLECLLETYTITADGRLMRPAGQRAPDRPRLHRDLEWPLHGDLVMYTRDPDREHGLHHLVVRFTHGRVEWIRRLAEGESPLGIPPSEPPEIDWSGDRTLPSIVEAEAQTEPALGGGEGRTAELRLLANLRRDRDVLQALLERCDQHWGAEDAVYRFYHQSFKVYAVQETTVAIVERLRALAPTSDRDLDLWFREIVTAGTGASFEPAHNERWLEVTRPMLEAFFHARYFLEMAVRYALLEQPPQALPSGYAALLHLYGLR